MSRGVLCAVLLALTVLGCAGDRIDGYGFPGWGKGETAVDRYWRRPLDRQGPAPADWPEGEASLAPKACGECHPDKYEEWRGSIHARAFPPLIAGQLLSFGARRTEMCMECHAPLAEQYDAYRAARPNAGSLHASVGMAAEGVTCAACHLRGHKVFGPADARTGETGPKRGAETAHDGVERVGWFGSADFCAPCHQGRPESGVIGESLLDTFAEWKAGPAAGEGKTCQGCHMPERRHLWRGIHDPEMVRSGLSAEFTADDQGARFTLTNSGVGHFFPTYAEPRVALYAVNLDDRGEPLPETASVHEIKRHARPLGNLWQTIADTRLPPGGSATLEQRWDDWRKVRFWVQVEPLDGYATRHFQRWLETMPQDDPGRRLVAEALERARGYGYRLFETVVEKPCGCGGGKLASD